ncbi:MAG: lipid A-modifier LpxR family protein, partial [Burkholderiaceae bacterium]
MRAHVLLGITLGWALCSSAHALTCSPEDEVTFHAASLRIENDLFINTDRDYTSGVSVALVSRDISGPLRSHCLPLWADGH